VAGPLKMVATSHILNYRIVNTLYGSSEVMKNNFPNSFDIQILSAADCW